MNPAPSPSRAGRALAALLCALALVYWVRIYRALATQPADYRDFTAYYIPVLAMAHGIDPYAYSFAELDTKLGHPMGTPDTAEPHPADTPVWLLMLRPLAWVGPRTAYTIWFWLNLGLISVSILLLVGMAGLRGSRAASVAALMSMYPPIATNFWFGQSQVVLLFVLVMMLWALESDADLASGGFLALAIWMRAYPLGLLVYLGVLRRWRALAAALVSIIALGLLTLAVLGIAPIRSFASSAGLLRGAGLLDYSRPFNLDIAFVRHPNNLNLAWAIRFPFDHTGRHPKLPINLLATGVEILLFLVVVARSWRLGARTDRYWALFSLWIITLTLLSPLAWTQFMVCFVPLFVGLFSYQDRYHDARRASRLALASFGLIVLFPPGGFGFPSLLDIAFVGHHWRLHYILWEAVPLSLYLAWAAAFVFVANATKAPALTASEPTVLEPA